MRVLNAVGDVLETSLCEAKLALVLDLDFIYHADLVSPEALMQAYRDQFDIELFDHDLTRCTYLRGFCDRHYSMSDTPEPPRSVNYYNDTLSVLFEWMAVFRHVFASTQVVEAYELFCLNCQMHHGVSVTELSEWDRWSMFASIHRRDKPIYAMVQLPA